MLFYKNSQFSIKNALVRTAKVTLSSLTLDGALAPKMEATLSLYLWVDWIDMSNTSVPNTHLRIKNVKE